MKTRCSSLPLIETCTAAARPPELRITSSSAEASLGTAVHEVILGEIAGQAVDVAASAAQHQVDPEDLGHLVWAARKIWNEQLKIHFPDPQVEMFMERVDGEFHLTGHADVLAVAGDMLLILDFKSGYLDQDHASQLFGYALLGLHTFPKCQQVYTAIARIRDFAREPIDATILTRAEVEAWWDRFKQKMSGPERFSPGQHCRFCPRGHECPARVKLLKNAMTLVAPGLVERVRLGAIYDAIKVLRDALDQAYDMVKAEVQISGPVNLGDGRELFITEEARTRIHFGPGRHILRQAIGDDHLGEIVSVSKTKALDLIRRQAPRGQKQAAVEEFLNTLAEVGALSQTTFSKLEVRYVNPTIEYANPAIEATVASAPQRQGS